MAPTQNPAQSKDNPEVLSDRLAERYEADLAKVRDLLTALGLDTRWVSRVSLCLHSHGRRGGGEGEVRPMTPELLVYGPDGTKVAEVTVRARSGAFLVSLPTDPTVVRIVPLGEPEQVAKLMPPHAELRAG
ncbi:hypothetical protein [Nonomuraea typhae]|uniref:hypothetical protein n=1 Tax=Nonomuraea typhae TaxID=2603600 RepID=UPI0012FB0DBC|nr:hypothetical protein [Nonomuraea typhae]